MDELARQGRYNLRRSTPPPDSPAPRFTILLAILDLDSSIQSSADLIVLGLSLGFLVLSLGIHEAAHAFAAWRCGDSTAKDMGRMTINPIPHIDPIMTILVPAVMFIFTNGGMMFGGAKPVPVAFHRLRHPLRDMSIVALAGPISNLLLAVLFMLVLKLLMFQAGFSSKEIATDVMRKSVQYNILLAVFNMIPVPPLDGSRVMTWLLPRSMRDTYNSVERYGILIVLGLLMFGPLRPVIFGAMNALTDFVDLITPGTVLQ